MTFNEYIAFAEQKEGQEILTAGERVTFRVEVAGNRLDFILESGLRRQESFPYVENFCSRFTETGSMITTDYPDTLNASYLIGLAREYNNENMV